MALRYEPMHVGGGAGDDHVLAAGHDAIDDRHTWSGVLPAPKMASGKASPKRPVVVDLGEAQVLIGEGFQAPCRLLRRNRAGTHGIEQLSDGARIH